MENNPQQNTFIEIPLVVKQPIFSALKESNITNHLNTRIDNYIYQIQDHYSPQRQLIATPNSHGLISALDIAFRFHFGVVLSPDMIWLMILQGLACHINSNPEGLRKYFVDFDGKKKIEVRRDSFIHGVGNNNNWEGVFQEFSEKIKTYIGEECHSLITSDFSSTGKIEKVCSELALMDAFQNFFDYSLETACGITSIKIEGTIEDWKAIKERAIGLSKYDLQWWVSKIIPILDQFINAMNGKIDHEFWGCIYKKWNQHGSGGGPRITGWILNFFPYQNKVPNKSLPDWSQYKQKIPNCPSKKPNSIHLGLSKAPFIWHYYSNSFEMEFLGGFLGVVRESENNTYLYPELGWVILEKKS